MGTGQVSVQTHLGLQFPFDFLSLHRGGESIINNLGRVWCPPYVLPRPQRTLSKAVTLVLGSQN